MAEFPFTINRASKIVSGGFLYQSDFADPDNYCEIKLSESTTITSTIVVPVNMNLNLSYYTLGLENDALLLFDSENIGYNEMRSGMLLAEAKDASTFTQNLNKVQKIIVTDDISDRIEITLTAAFTNSTLYNKVKIQRHYNTADATYNVAFDIPNITVDLCGHD